jgi:hypothetical protein
MPAPFALPMPSLFNTSFTSPGPASLLLCCVLERTGVSLRPSACVAEVWSRVDIDAAVSRRFEFDMLFRPSNASRRSVTPTPRVERARLARDKLSICINAVGTLTRGARPSARLMSKSVAFASTAIEIIRQWPCVQCIAYIL